jgi:oligopeptide transport system permease protein
MRSSMLDVLGQDYMRTAKAKGLSQKVSLLKHALRNAILPIITYLGPMIAYTLTGSVIVEKICTIPGLGGEFIRAINGRHYTMIMGTTIFLATFMIIMNVVVDIVYKIVDPRITLK